MTIYGIHPNERRAPAKANLDRKPRGCSAERTGRGGKEKGWTDCVQSDIRAFGMTGDWKTTALEAEVWVETVTEGGRRFMAAWRKEEVDAARHRQEKRSHTAEALNFAK